MYRGVVTGEGRDELEGKYKLDEYIALRRVVCGLVVVVSFEGEFVGLNWDSITMLRYDTAICYRASVSTNSPGFLDNQRLIDKSVISARCSRQIDGSSSSRL